MNRAQFMEQLKRLLSDISAAERDEALEYYNNYFDDAGPENEAAVIRELGSPGKVAAIIKADLNESSEDYASYTERGYTDSRVEEERMMPERFGEERKQREERENSEGREEGASSDRARRGYRPGKKRNTIPLVLILILLVFCAPFLTGAFGGVMGVLITIILLPVIAVFVIGALALGLTIGGAACAAAGIALCFSYPATGILTVGVGCIMAALGILFLVAFVWVAGRLLPVMIRKTTDFIQRLFDRGRKEGART